MVVACGAGLSCIQLGMLEHAERLKPQAAIAITRLMIDTVRSRGDRRIPFAAWPAAAVAGARAGHGILPLNVR